MKFVLVSLISLFGTFSISAQANFRYGPEISISFSKKPMWESRDDLNAQYSSSDLPLPGPGIGLYGELLFDGGLLINSSISYQIAGNRFHAVRDWVHTGTGRPISSKGTIESWRKLTFHKLRIPFSIGYCFNTLKTNPSIYAGANINWIFSSKYTQSSVSTYENKPDFTTKSSYSIDPLNTDTSIDPIKYQMLIGGSAQISNNIRLALEYNYGPNQYFDEYQECFNICFLDPFKSYTNQDLTIRVAWLFD